MIDVNKGELPDVEGVANSSNLTDRMQARFESFLRFMQLVNMPNAKRRRGESAMTASRRRKRNQIGRVRLGRPTGPTSLDELTKQKFQAYLDRQAAKLALASGGPVFYEPTPASILDDPKTLMREEL